jgi:thiol-activated cytolysin
MIKLLPGFMQQPYFRKTYSFRNIKITVASLALLLCCSCARKELTDMIKPSGKGLSALPKFVQPVVRIDIKNPKKNTGVLLTPESILNHRKLNGPPGTTSSIEPMGIPTFNNGINQATSIYTQMFRANEFVVNTTISNDVFPGSIIQGSTVADFILKGIYGYSKPITVSVSIPTSPQKVAKVIPVPSSSAMRQVVRDALKNEFSGQGGFSNFNYEMKSFSYYQEMKVLYGYNSKTNLLFVNNATSSGRNVDAIYLRTGIMVKFMQQNFTVDMDIPEAGELINRNVDPSVFGGVAPLYVSSVTYGRLGIMTIETAADEETATTVFRKAFSFLGVINSSNILTTEEKAIIDASEIKVSVAGVNGEDAVRTINGLSGLTELVTKGLTYTPESPGVPITFKMRYVSDDSNVGAPFEVNYGPFDKVYARFEYENKYVVQDSPNETTSQFADIYLAFYQDQFCTVPTSAYNFIPFDYKKTLRIVDESEFSDHTTVSELSTGKVLNSTKGTRLLMNTRELISSSKRLRNPGSYNHIKNSTYSYVLLPANPYIELPAKK